MFDEVLKRFVLSFFSSSFFPKLTLSSPLSGSLIVDGLSDYKQPVFVYIVPNGELRGGAWVVLDPSINANGMMEMFVLLSLSLSLRPVTDLFSRTGTPTRPRVPVFSSRRVSLRSSFARTSSLP
jgi:hypothetical protein